MPTRLTKVPIPDGMFFDLTALSRMGLGSRETLAKRIREGQLHAVMLHNRRMVSRAELQRFVDSLPRA